jgi:hypothetical protein
MKRTSMVIIPVLTLALLVYAHVRTSKARSEEYTSHTQTAIRDRTAATESRLNRYFQGEVTPKLRKCWDLVKGDGRIAVGLTYTKTGSSWTWEQLRVTSSTLLKEQDAIAIKCVQDSVRGTSFPVQAEDQARDKVGSRTANRSANNFVVNWSFPVPLPTNASTALARATGGAGGSAEACWVCGNDNQGGVCVKNPSGWPGCVETDGGDQGSGCICLGNPCASGGYAGTRGLLLMR